MDEQAVAGADRFRSMLLRVLVLVGGVLAGTALAWLLSAATASAAEANPVTDLVATAGSVVDDSVAHTVHLGQDAGLAAQALPAAAPAVPALQVPVPHLVAPVILVEQKLGDIAAAQPVHDTANTAVTSTFVAAGEVRPAVRAVPAPAVSRIEHGAEPVAAVAPQAAAMSAPAVQLPSQDGSPKSEALPFGSLPGNACGHDGPSGNAGMCLGDGVVSTPADTSVRPTRAVSRCVPMTARRQPGITPD
ncbi:hypothetical protein [Kutzneria sp. CA-103260]|uniref:hypothetical protein n=1 Tax=Kutzneria sp. CA-103260 TaxID=2802641 RepID=UPI001BA90CA5|nr:hypothetical protein [Kutzneria sp. CA-103260]QUQ69642.1 hypothetical protein JJ691_74020 [Kutzneria sp. CA-103260]